MLSKFAYPSIEYVLATAHYPEEFRKEARHYPTFFPAPPVQVFHVAGGHIPLFVPLPRQQLGGHKPPKPRIIRYRVKGKPHEKLILERITERVGQASSRQRPGRHQARNLESQSLPSLVVPTSSDSSEISESEIGNEAASQSSSQEDIEANVDAPQIKADNDIKQSQVSKAT